MTSGPNSGEVTIQIKTLASGVDNVSPWFQFNIVPINADGVEESRREFVHYMFNYQNNKFETITVRDLEQGQSYTFSATATNIYGTSEVANSRSISAGRLLN